MTAVAGARYIHVSGAFTVMDLLPCQLVNELGKLRRFPAIEMDGDNLATELDLLPNHFKITTPAPFERQLDERLKRRSLAQLQRLGYQVTLTPLPTAA